MFVRSGRWQVAGSRLRAADNGAGSGGGGDQAGGQPDDNKALAGQETGQNGQQRSADAPPASWDEVFQHDRFKQLVKRAKEAEAALEKTARDQEAAEAAKLKEQQRYEELYQKAEAKAAELEKRLTETQRATLNERKRRAVEDAARAHEPRFSAEAIKDVPVFVDLDGLEVGEDGSVKGVEAAIKALAKDRPYMLEQKRQDPGSPAGKRPAGSPQPQQQPRRPLTL